MIVINKVNVLMVSGVMFKKVVEFFNFRFMRFFKFGFSVGVSKFFKKCMNLNILKESFYKFFWKNLLI